MYLFFVPNPSDIMRIRGNFVISRINLEAEIMKKKKRGNKSIILRIMILGVALLYS